MEEDKLNLLRNFLNRDSIKLWLEPYTTSPSLPGIYPEEMISKYQQELQLNSRDDTLIYLEALRKKALENLQAREEYRKTGIAKLKVKAVSSDKKEVQINVGTPLNVSGRQLKEKLTDLLKVPSSTYLKIISMGKVLQDDPSLQDQKIKNQSHLLVLVLDESERTKVVQSEQYLANLEKTKAAASYLSSNDPVLEVADQHGKILNIPPEERKAICLALAIYNKGRQSLQARRYSEALVFFLEAESYYMSCNPALFSAVDNYALLCLDIAWCYLLLNNLDQLPDAETRLQESEKIFKKSYGLNMERLEALKGDSTKEQALFTRLYLLKGIVAYHKHQLDEAKFWLDMAGSILRDLKVDEEQLSHVMNMGFSLPEARLALRRARGNVDLAVEHIISEKKRKEQLFKEEEKKEKQRRVERKLGFTLDGSKVKIQYYLSLASMGFEKPAVIQVLRETNNNLELSIQRLTELKENKEDFPNSNLQPSTSRESKSSASKTSTSSSSDTETSGSTESTVDAKEYRDFLRIPSNIEDHLDLSLEEEENYILQYKKLIESISHQ